MTKEKHPKLFGLIGKNIDYSFSRAYFSEKFEKEHLSNHSYVNFDLDKIEEFVGIKKKNPTLQGLNVTIPYKKAIIPYLDRLSEEAKAIGAVNTILWDKQGNSIGHNTDHTGFEKALREKTKNLPKKALILGTGGASGAVRYALEKMGCEVIFVSRVPRQGQYGYQDLDAKRIDGVQLIVNSTPVGTFPNIEMAPPIPYDLLHSNHLLFDLIYNPSQTRFMKNGEKQGAQTLNGYQMLVYQAEKSWELWNQ